MYKITKLRLNVIIAFVFILTISNSQAIDTTDSQLVAVWFFDEAEGEEVTDLSENGIHGDIMGDVKCSNQGVYNSCLEFPGNAESYVEIPHSALLNPCFDTSTSILDN